MMEHIKLHPSNRRKGDILTNRRNLELESAATLRDDKIRGWIDDRRKSLTGQERERPNDLQKIGLIEDNDHDQDAPLRLF